MSVWSRVTSLIAGGAVATAASDGVRPVLEPVRQHAWSRNRQRALDVGTTAQLVAQAIIGAGEADDEAARNGYNGNRLQALIKLAQTMPGQADLDRMLNREKIDRELFNEALAKHQVDPRFWDALFDLTNDKLSVADVAAAVQQGHLANEGILPDISAAVQPAQGHVTPQAPDQQPPSHVPLTQIGIDPVVEAAADGFDLPRLKVRANLAGLPPGADTLLQMWNRELIDEESVDAGIREGHLKTKWAGAFKRMRWAVLSASEYANLHIRGWITTQEMYLGGALTGHTTDQMDLLYLNRGRPLAPQQAATAWARDAPHPEGPGYPTRPGTFDEEDFLRALKQSDVRTEYGPILWHNRFAYPSMFQLNRLVQAGAVDAATAADWAHKDRYAPEVIAALTKYWGSLGATAGKEETRAELRDEYEGGYLTEPEFRAALTQLGYAGPALELEVHLGDARRIKKWREKAIDAIEAAFASFKIDDTTATTELAQLNVLGDAATSLLAVWRLLRLDTVRLLTPAQVKKAYTKGLIDQATALTELDDRGYTPDDAAVFLAE